MLLLLQLLNNDNARCRISVFQLWGVAFDGAIMSVAIKNNDFFCYLLMNFPDKMPYKW